MAARFWRLQLALELAVAAGIAWGLSSWLSLRTAAALALALAVFLFLQFLLVAASIVLGRVLTHGVPGTFIPWRVLFSEGPLFLIDKLAMSVEPWLRQSEHPPSPSAGDQRPVLLIHGVLCNRAVWRGLQRRLCAAGYSPVRALNLSPLFADIDEYARQVVKELSLMRTEARGARVAIVGHSMGGLVARAALRDAADAVSRIITVGTPHHGSMLVRFAPGAAARQMLPGSEWLKRFNAMPRPESVPITSIYSTDDNHVAPAASAELAGAELRALGGLGHFGLLHSAQVLRYLLAALSQGGTQASEAAWRSR